MASKKEGKFNPQEIIFFNAMTLGLIMATRQEIQAEIKPLPRKAVEEVFIPETVLEPSKWHKAQLDKQNK